MNFDVNAPLTSTIGAVGEFGFATDDQTEPGVSGNLKFYNLGGGARWTMDTSGRLNGRAIAPFVQLVIGAVHTDADLVQNGAPFHAADWPFMLQPGAGVTLPISSMVGLVGQVDYRRAFFSQSENEVRFLFGVRLNPR